MSNLIGQSLGRYHILEPLGEGGMAVVYKAYDTRLEREVAVKVIRTERLTIETMARTLKRFEREAKALARLTHPNIVQVSDYGEHEGAPYLVMPYLPGGTLKARLGKPIPWREAVRILLPVVRALAYAHEQGVIHRDGKPSNILITEDGDPLLTDFGIAKILTDTEATVDLTGTGVGVGTPEYMAPEQFQGQVGPGTDVYALGVVLYEMVAGRKPYAVDTPASIIVKQATDPLPRPTQFVADLPDAVEKVLLKALARRPEDRYQNMGEVAAALEGLPVGGGQPAAPGRKREKPKAAQAAAGSRRDEAVAAARPAKADGAASRNPERGKRAWEPWAAGLGGLLAAGLGLALGIGLLLLGTRGQGPLAGLATATATATATRTPTRTLTPTMTFTPTPGIGLTWRRPVDGMEMVYVPAGEFTMGMDAGASLVMCNRFLIYCSRSYFTEEEPVHTVYLDAYWIDRTEVTNGMYALCVAEGSCEPPSSARSSTRSRYYGNPEYADYPVINVDWNDAQAYCAWAGGRLLTEAEWEKAARGTDARIYPWGDTFHTTVPANYGGIVSDTGRVVVYPAPANYGDRVGDTERVGTYPAGASPYGALDMAGNVWEWVADWSGETYYASSPERNPTGPASGTYRVLRGGSWNGNGISLRAAYRYWGDPSAADYRFGFRCARSEASP
ncbi:MAG: SUMF1/EgtB/PvdO family nonheme iron enzyme [Anaerolineales bacterium]|nr:SUMF1/EgtB/PvdO family nonheme iron enzyme [Anaerolineales bacterium]